MPEKMNKKFVFNISLYIFAVRLKRHHHEKDISTLAEKKKKQARLQRENGYC